MDVETEVWHTTPDWRKGHLLRPASSHMGATWTVCARESPPITAWVEAPDLAEDERCGQCRLRSDAGAR